ncbi:MAG: PH domain-containing protein [Chloroflexota bacterium]
MDDHFEIEPARKFGYFIQVTLAAILASLAVASVAQAYKFPLGTLFLLFLFAGLLLALPVPVLLYRTYALYRSNYIVGRDGLQVRWGLRELHIPMTDIEWVRLENTLEQPLNLPQIRWPGGVLGTRKQAALGDVEFIANRTSGLVLIGAKQGIIALSPPDQKVFIQSFRKQIELGPLKAMDSRSVYPSFLLAELWKLKWARGLLLLGLGLNIAQLLWVAIAIPSTESISLGFAPNGALLPPVASVQLFLLPILSLFFYLGNSTIAAYFFRKDERHPLAYILWGSSVITTSIFLFGVILILQVN